MKGWAQSGDPSGQFRIAYFPVRALTCCLREWSLLFLHLGEIGKTWMGRAVTVGTVGVCLDLLSASFSPFAALHPPDSPHPQPSTFQVMLVAKASRLAGLGRTSKTLLLEEHIPLNTQQQSFSMSLHPGS